VWGGSQRGGREGEQTPAWRCQRDLQKEEECTENQSEKVIDATSISSWVCVQKTNRLLVEIARLTTAGGLVESWYRRAAF
jgi:hypothetical protein